MTDQYIYQSLFTIVSLVVCRTAHRLWRQRATLPTIEARLDRESLALKAGTLALLLTWAK